MDNTFTDWLNTELNVRNWSYADLSKKSGISQAHISKVFSGQRGVGIEFCEKIARALDLPTSLVFRKAGILPPEPEKTKQREELNYLFDKFPEDEKSDLLKYMRIKLMMFERDGKIDK
ncbi:MAG TPA: hypothetical protein DCK95_06920 [Anaerolineaceae bacterium]|nr:hypothetical protein [Anaerolineaceae bacterium]